MGSPADAGRLSSRRLQLFQTRTGWCGFFIQQGSGPQRPPPRRRRRPVPAAGRPSQGLPHPGRRQEPQSAAPTPPAGMAPWAFQRSDCQKRKRWRSTLRSLVLAPGARRRDRARWPWSGRRARAGAAQTIAASARHAPRTGAPGRDRRRSEASALARVRCRRSQRRRPRSAVPRTCAGSGLFLAPGGGRELPDRACGRDRSAPKALACAERRARAHRPGLPGAPARHTSLAP